MRVAELNWMQLETLAAGEDRAVLPLGSTEQHATLSLATDSILAERIAAEAAEPLGIPVFPVLSYGITPRFMAYPGTVTLTIETHLRVLRELLDGIAAHGFRRIVVVNGHGGNAPGRSLAAEWACGHAGVKVKWHDWWNGPATQAQVHAFDPVASHASWMESFPWTRVTGAEAPAAAKPMVDSAALLLRDPAGARALLGDGNYGGHHRRPDREMEAIWAVAVAETRAVMAERWE